MRKGSMNYNEVNAILGRETDARPNSNIVANLRGWGMRKKDALLVCGILSIMDSVTNIDELNRKLDKIKRKIEK